METKVNVQNWAELDFLINNFYEIVEYKRGRGIYGDRVILKRSKRPECGTPAINTVITGSCNTQNTTRNTNTIASDIKFNKAKIKAYILFTSEVILL